MVETVTMFNVDDWRGGFWWWYDLCIDLGPSGPANDAAVVAALRAMWAHDDVYGVWANQDEVGDAHLRSPLPNEVPDSLQFLHGLISFGSAGEAGCFSYVSRPENGRDDLVLAVPAGMLTRLFEVSYPLLRATNPWLTIVDEKLVQIAEAVYASAPFDIAWVGEEAACVKPPSDAISPSDLARGGVMLSPDFCQKLSPPMPFQLRRGGLRWKPSAE